MRYRQEKKSQRWRKTHREWKRGRERNRKKIRTLARGSCIKSLSLSHIMMWHQVKSVKNVSLHPRVNQNSLSPVSFSFDWGQLNPYGEWLSGFDPKRGATTTGEGGREKERERLGHGAQELMLFLLHPFSCRTLMCMYSWYVCIRVLSTFIPVFLFPPLFFLW